jgi:kinesin family protein 3/17
MLATISMSVEDYEETLSTLRYANRAKQIKNKPRINEDPKDTMLRQMQEEIQRLKALLEVRTGSAGKRPSLTRSTTCAAENGGNGDGNRAQNPAFGHLDSAGLDRLQAQVQSEQQSLANATDKTSQEKEAIQTELDLSMQDIERERAARQELAERLKALESNMLVGGVNIFEQVSSQQAQLIEASIRIQEQRRKERELQKQLESRQEQQLQAEESYASLQEEVDVKTRKLKKLWGIVQSAKQEVGDLQDEFRHEREDLLDTIRELTKEISLKSTILANFVSDEQRVTIESLASYHDEADEWVLQSQMSITPTIQPNMAALSMPRPKSAHGSARSEEDGGRAGHSRQGSGATRPKSRKVSSAGRVPSASSPGSAGNRGQGTPLRNEVV